MLNPNKKVFDRILCILIVLSVILAVVDTEPDIKYNYAQRIAYADGALAIIFSFEYGLRCVRAYMKQGGWRGLIRHVLNPLSITDLVAIAPSFVGLVCPEFYALRVIRLARVCKLGKSRFFTQSVCRFVDAIKSKGNDLMVSLLYTSTVLAVSSVGMYAAEGAAQPEQFGSVLRSLWWSVVTVTTIGYGDVYPVTAVGRLIAAVTALLGISTVAIPIGIFTAAFGAAVEDKRESVGECDNGR